MATLAKSFTATGNGTGLSISPGDKFTYSVSGTFSGTVVLEKSLDGGATWTTLVTATEAASGTLANSSPKAATYRFRCSAFVSGTIVTALADVATTVQTLGNGVLVLKEDGIEVVGNISPSGSVIRTGRQLSVNAAGKAKVGATAGWVVAAADNVALVTCPASQTASTLVLPLHNLNVGDTITGFNLVGQVESAGGAVTVDCALRKHTAAAGDVADASVGAITQVAVTADTILSSTTAGKTGLTEVVGVDETFYLLITATTAGSTDIALQGAVITITEA